MYEGCDRDLSPDPTPCCRAEVPPGAHAVDAVAGLPPEVPDPSRGPRVDQKELTDADAGGAPDVAVTGPAPPEAPDGVDDDPDGAGEGEGFSEESVRFLAELPGRRLDAGWHERNREHFAAHLHLPTSALLRAVRDTYVRPLGPEVAAGRRQLSSLTKSGYGRGRYHDHYGFAFYDPAAASKARSAQLYFKLSGADGTCEYGFSTGAGCDDYLLRLRQALGEAPDAVAAQLKSAPEGTEVNRQTKDHARQWKPAEWAALLRGGASLALGTGLGVTEFAVRRVIPLSELPTLGPKLLAAVGEFFTWAWPFFQASCTGAWPRGAHADAADVARQQDQWALEVDEHAPRTLEELSERTSLPLSLLRGMEDALLTQHQIVLTGPPGTSKTYVAGQFARYFARQRPGQPQGATHALYMHTNWSYEDFFEGLRPVEQNGRLVFENKPGLFLRWVNDELRGQHPRARHVVVLDELNRCDTAAVLGELLQLLEYRGVTVPLLSGRPFVFPANLYVIGTMNSADRSVGRMDLALRRRFFWIDLLPQPDVLARWLARPGNNPAGFDAAALAHCNQFLVEHGIPPEQQVGHALFMGKADPEAGEAEPAGDLPLTARRLRQVVLFSVLPYVRELLVSRTGQTDDGLLRQVECALLACLDDPQPSDGARRRGARSAGAEE